MKRTQRKKTLAVLYLLQGGIYTAAFLLGDQKLAWCYLLSAVVHFGLAALAVLTDMDDDKVVADCQ